jgi:carbon monoxide dehydrogenase subunit G
MALGQEKPLLAKQEYVIGASRQRVWDLLASNVIQSMPIEQMEFVNDSTLKAVLKFKAGFIEVPTPVKVDVADISPNESFTTVVTASKAGLKSVLRVEFKLADVSEEQTSVTCTVVEESGSPIMRLLRWQQRQFAGKIFNTVKERLESCC